MRNFAFIALVLVVLFISAGYALPTATWADDIAQAKKAFDSMDIIPESYSINAWASVDNKKRGEAELKQLSSDVVNRIKVMAPPCRYDITNDQQWLQVYAYGTSRYGDRISVSAQSLYDGTTRQNYITVNADGSAKADEFNAIALSIERAMEQYGGLNMNAALWGYVKGKVPYEAYSKLYARAFEMLDAEYIEGIDSEGLVSITAYSPAIKHYVEIKGRKANIQLAVRYNAYQDRTYIWLGVPLLTVEY